MNIAINMPAYWQICEILSAKVLKAVARFEVSTVSL